MKQLKMVIRRMGMTGIMYGGLVLCSKSEKDPRRFVGVCKRWSLKVKADNIKDNSGKSL